MTSPTQVAIIGPLPPIKGGISQHTSQLAAALADAGCEVQRYSWRSQYPKRLYGRAQIDPAAPRTPDVCWWLRWWNPITWARVAWRVRNDTVVVLPWVSPVHALAQLVIMVLASRPLAVIHVHNVVPHEPLPFSSLLARTVLNRADLLVCHAESLAKEAEALGVRTPTLVTSHPPDLPIEPTSLPVAPPTRLLFLGMIRHYKGLDIALEACADLGDVPGLELTVAGEVWSEADRPSSATLERLPMPVTARFEYLGDDDMVELLHTHHLLLAPYRSATQSGVVSMALAAGRPVAATRVGGLGEVLHEGENGVLAAADDPDDFASAIRRALADLESLAAGARETHSSWAGYAAAVLDRVEVLSATSR